MADYYAIGYADYQAGVKRQGLDRLSADAEESYWHGHADAQDDEEDNQWS